MKCSPILCLFVAAFAEAAVSLRAAETNDLINQRQEIPRERMAEAGRRDGIIEKLAVTYLGIETSPVGPTLTVQLGLPADIGLIVTRVLEGSPAVSLLKVHDILTKFEDQMLIDAHQFGVLVRSRQDGEEVKLTLYRAGKEIALTVKLGQRKVPRPAGVKGVPRGEFPDSRFFHEELLGPGGHGTHRLPGMEPEDVHNVLRMIGRERRNWFGAPPVHFFKRLEDEGSTMLNLAEGNFVFTDDHGSVEVKAGEGIRELTVKNPNGDVVFLGPINDAGDRAKLPPEVVERLEKIENVDLNDEPGEDFEQEIAVEPPAQGAIRHELNFAGSRVSAPPPPSF